MPVETFFKTLLSLKWKITKICYWKRINVLKFRHRNVKRNETSLLWMTSSSVVGSTRFRWNRVYEPSRFTSARSWHRFIPIIILIFPVFFPPWRIVGWPFDDHGIVHRYWCRNLSSAIDFNHTGESSVSFLCAWTTVALTVVLVFLVRRKRLRNRKSGPWSWSSLPPAGKIVIVWILTNSFNIPVIWISWNIRAMFVLAGTLLPLRVWDKTSRRLNAFVKMVPTWITRWRRLVVYRRIITATLVFHKIRSFHIATRIVNHIDWEIGYEKFQVVCNVCATQGVYIHFARQVQTMRMVTKSFEM